VDGNPVVGQGDFQPLDLDNMTSEEFHGLVKKHAHNTGRYDEWPLTALRLAEIEREIAIELPGFYKEFLSIYGAGDFGAVTVLSPDPKSEFPAWESNSIAKNRECNFIGVVDVDSDYYGFLVEQGICSNDIWRSDRDLGNEVSSTGYPDFFEFLAKAALGVWSDGAEEDEE
jgi:SMI1-KNR4 cell-wall